MASSSDTVERPFRFFDLPPEIRVMVYEELFLSTTLIPLADNRRRHWPLFSDFNMAAMRTCRQLKWEIEDVFYRNEFEFAGTNFYGGVSPAPACHIRSVQQLIVQLFVDYSVDGKNAFRDIRLEEGQTTVIHELCRALHEQSHSLQSLIIVMHSRQRNYNPGPPAWVWATIPHLRHLCEQPQILPPLEGFRGLLAPFQKIRNVPKVEVRVVDESPDVKWGFPLRSFHEFLQVPEVEECIAGFKMDLRQGAEIKRKRGCATNDGATSGKQQKEEDAE